MATMQERAAKLAVQFAEVVAKEFYGDEGPALNCDIDEIEDVAVRAALPGASGSTHDSRPAGLGQDRRALLSLPRLRAGFFFPQREPLRLDSQCLTPRARRILVHAGGKDKSFQAGAESLREYLEWDLKPTRVAEYTLQAGQELKALQTAKVEALQSAPPVKERTGRPSPTT